MCVAATESVGWGGVKSLQPQAHRTAAPSHAKNREIVKGGPGGGEMESAGSRKTA